MSVPIGILTAIYLVEYGGGRLARSITFLVDVMTGIPSIVAGLFAYALFAIFFGDGVPDGLRRRGRAVAADDPARRALLRGDAQAGAERAARGVVRARRAKWRTIIKVVLPTALAGIVTGVTIAIARVIGETAPLLIIAGATDSTNLNPFSGRMMTLPVYIFSQYRNPGIPPEFSFDRAWGAALVLIVIVMLLNLIARLISYFFSPKTKHDDDPSTIRTEPRTIVAKSIDVSDLNIYYGSFMAVEGVTIPIAARSVTAFIGPSGCGKSTFLRSLNRMHEVIPGARVEGKIVIDGRDLYDPEVDPVEVRRQIGMVFQRPNPFPTMSIAENVLAGKKLNGKRLDKADADEVVEKSLRGANLWNEVKDRLNKPGSGLSGGQQQRLCIARAIAVEPQVLLMDEPCSALDPISTSAIEDLIQELKESYTIVIVTHNMQQAARVSETTAFFNLAGVGKPGQLIEYGATTKIFSNPDNPATEAYISGRFG